MKRKKLNDMQLSNFHGHHHTWKEKTRHFIQFDFTQDDEINIALHLVFGYFHRSMSACANAGKVHPPLEIYVSCLSENFANGALIKAREHGIIPPFNKKMH